jgi:cold shock CspA family protein
MPTGRIASFDAQSGLGMITPDGSQESVMFHCIEITDGSRSIAEGTAVSYVEGLKLGRSEAFAVTQLL